MAVPVKKGVEFDCPMFEVRCTQPCASGGLRHTDKCPYDNGLSRASRASLLAHDRGAGHYIDRYNYNSNSKKGVDTMAKPTTTAPANSGGNNGNFQPTFRKYNDMSDSEKACFRQGAKTSENKVKERLGFTPPRDAKKN